MVKHTLLALAILAGTATAARAQGWIDIERRPGIPVNTSVFRVSSSVRTRVDGRVATIEVEEQFRNSGGGVAEGTYLYPLPGEAVFQNFSLWMGENEVRGEMMNAEQARGIYEEIVRRMRDPALLTLEGHGLVRARVFPIQPGETRKVVLRTQLTPSHTGPLTIVDVELGLQRVSSVGGGLDGVMRHATTSAMVEVVENVDEVAGSMDGATVQAVESALTARALEEANQVYDSHGADAARQVLELRAAQVGRNKYLDAATSTRLRQANEAAIESLRVNPGTKAKKVNAIRAYELAR